MVLSPSMIAWEGCCIFYSPSLIFFIFKGRSLEDSLKTQSLIAQLLTHHDISNIDVYGSNRSPP